MKHSLLFTLGPTLGLCTMLLTTGDLLAAETAPAAAPLPHVAVGKVTEAENIKAYHYAGQLQSPQKVNLVSRVSGDLLAVTFQEGDFVHKDQPLYELDAVRYEAALKSAMAKIAEVNARLTYAESNHERLQRLFDQKASSRDTLENATSELEACKAELLEAEANLTLAQDDLKNTKIIAPISGKIGLTSYTQGNYLTPSSGTLATIVQVDPLRLSFSISARNFLRQFGTEKALKENARVQIKLADDTIYNQEGTVEFVDNEANRRTDTVQVYVSIPNPDHRLLAGNTVTVLLTNRNAERLPAIVPTAIMHDAEGPYLYVVNDQNKVEQRRVVLGNILEDLQLIVSGVKPGETVVTDGMHKTQPGGTVIPHQQED